MSKRNTFFVGCLAGLALVLTGCDALDIVDASFGLAGAIIDVAT